MKKTLLALIALLGLIFSVTAGPGHPAENQLVTLRITYQEWNEYRPWQKSTPGTRTALGVVVPGNRILVMSEYLRDATLIELEKHDRPPRVPARIIHNDPQANLALLTADESFFTGLTPVKIADQMEGDNHYCLSWESGQLISASCRFSRVVVRSSFVPYFSYAGIYFATDLQDGGRGEPIFYENQMVGIIRQQNDNLAIAFPAELIQSYLKAVDQPDYPGFSYLGANWQLNRGSAQAKHFGLEGIPRGILIRSCLKGGSADGVLQANDLLLELDGHPIDCQGDYMHPRYGWLDHKLISTENHYAGDILKAVVLRDGQELTLDIPLKNMPASLALIPDARPGNPPPFLFAGGLVFREFDVPYLRAWGNKWYSNIPARFRIYLELEAENHSDGEKLIVLSSVFADEYNLGYHDMAQNIVTAVNGRTIYSIAEMAEAFKHPLGDFHVIQLVPTYGLTMIVLDAKEFEAATTRIMETYQIPSRIRLNDEPTW